MSSSYGQKDLTRLNCYYKLFLTTQVFRDLLDLTNILFGSCARLPLKHKFRDMYYVAILF